MPSGSPSTSAAASHTKNWRTFDAYVRRDCVDSGAATRAATYASSTPTNPSSRSTGARPRRARGSAVVFSEADSGRSGRCFCAFHEATPGVYFRERYFSEVAPPGISNRLRTPGHQRRRIRKVNDLALTSCDDQGGARPGPRRPCSHPGAYLGLGGPSRSRLERRGDSGRRCGDREELFQPGHRLRLPPL
jgi:hypothetical protein